MNKKIKYSENQFNTVTEGSFKLANIISADVASALIAEGLLLPAVVILATYFSPLRTAYATAFSQWVSAVAFRIGQTNRVKDLLASLAGEKIEDWDVAIRAVYRKGSSEYMTIFPFGRKPFQRGGIDERITKLEALMERLTNPALAAVLADVTTFLQLLSAARDTQQQLEETVQIRSSLLEKARVDVCNGLFYVAGGLMQVFHTDPDQINRFFPLEKLVRRTTGGNEEPTPGQSVTGIVRLNSVNNLFSDGFSGSSIVQIKNIGDVPLKFYTANSPTGLPATGSVSVEPGQTLEVGVDQINQPVGTYFNVINTNETDGKYEVNILSV
jgi:hypothetical protein